MPNDTARPPWRTGGASVCGAQHVRRGLPNQDALLTWVAERGSPVLVAVADGHGGAEHFRSGQGSRLAVDAVSAALRLSSSLLDGDDPLARAPEIDAMVRRELVARWRAAVAAHVAAHPVTAGEWAALAATDGDGAVRRVKADLAIAYGSTVLAAMHVFETLVLVQLGDGDILCVDETGATRRPFVRDTRLIANVTTSLCLPDADDEVRVRVMTARRDAHQPVLVLLSTDGYANAFASDEDFLAVGPDVLSHIGTRGLTALQADLPSFLEDASTNGSGDDITLGILTRAEDGVALIAPPGRSVTPLPRERSAPDERAMLPVGAAGGAGGAMLAAATPSAATPAARRDRGVMVALGIGAIIILVAAVLFATNIPCAPLPLRRPACTMDSAKGRAGERANEKTKGDEKTNATSDRDSMPAPKGKGKGKAGGEASPK